MNNYEVSFVSASERVEYVLADSFEFDHTSYLVRFLIDDKVIFAIPIGRLVSIRIIMEPVNHV